MSALGWGILVGSVAVSVIFIPKAFEKPAGPMLLSVIGGIIGSLLVGEFSFPEGLGFAGFLLGLAITNGPCWIFGRQTIEAQTKRRAAVSDALREAKEKVAALKLEIEKAKAAWLNTLTGWNYQTFGQILNLQSRPSCIIALGGDDRLLRVIQFDEKTEFQIISDKVLALSKIITLDVAAPSITRTVYDTQAVPIVSKKKRSTVGRAAVGAVLLGPLGAVVGAASGLNGPLTTKVEERKVARTIESKGDPQLIIGIADVEVPVLKIQLVPPHLADEWVHRIRAAQMKR